MLVILDGVSERWNQQLNIIGVIDDVNILIFQFTNDTMDTASLHPHAGAYRINTVIVGFHGHFRPFTGFTDDLFDHDQSVKNFRYFYFQQFGQK